MKFVDISEFLDYDATQRHCRLSGKTVKISPEHIGSIEEYGADSVALFMTNGRVYVCHQDVKRELQNQHHIELHAIEKDNTLFN